MTADQFRKLARSFPEASESEHMVHPDFRIGGKIFATLGYPDEGWAVVKLTSDQQGELIGREPEIFRRVKGGWGRRGQTQIFLAAAKIDIVRDALTKAWRNTAPKKLLVKLG